jgi:peroxiredoxin
LTELFLLNEQADQEIVSFYTLTPELFIKKMDSIDAERQAFLEDFLQRNDVSSGFKEVANAAIDYSIYGKMELYITSNYKKQRFGADNEIPASFFNYRSDIDLGNEDLRTYYPYFRSLGYYFDNLAFETIEGTQEFNRMSFDHNWHKMDLIHNRVINDSLEQSLLKNTVINYLINAEHTEHMELIMDKFFNYNQSREDETIITELAQLALNMMPGQTLPNVELVSYDNHTFDIHDVIERPTVVYFWSMNAPKHVKNIHERVSELRKKYPEFDFIGLNVDDQFKKWQRLVQHEHYRHAHEFQFENFDAAGMQLLVNSISKCMMIDPEAVIIESHTNIFSLDAEQKMLNYLNQ